LTEELIHVPLLVRVPGATKREVAQSPFSMLHLSPTLLDAADLPVPSAFEGLSLWEQLREGRNGEEFAISESVADCTNPFRPENRLGARVLAIREQRFKLVLHFGPRAESLYDLDADPREQAPVPASDEKPARRRLLEHARAHVQRSISRRDHGARLQAQLRELRLEWGKPADKAAPLAS
jgi:arylsulfatase A-like enzyme